MSDLARKSYRDLFKKSSELFGLPIKTFSVAF